MAVQPAEHSANFSKGLADAGIGAAQRTPDASLVPTSTTVPENLLDYANPDA